MSLGIIKKEAPYGESVSRKAIYSIQDNMFRFWYRFIEDAGESRNQIKRYIRLTYLIPELLEMVDDGKIAFNPAVEISYLEHSEQLVLLDAMSLNDCTPSHAQAIRLKKMSQDGVLTDEGIHSIMSEEKPNQAEQIRFKRDDFKEYFPPRYTDEQIKRDILKGLELLKRQRDRSRDAR